MVRMNRLVPSLALLIAALTTAACTSSGENVIKIGAAVSETGRYAEEGKHVRQGYRLWADWVNDDLGGIEVGSHRYRVELVIYDDGGEVESTAALVEKLIDEDGVDFLLGPYSSTLTGAAMEVAEARDVPMVEGAGASETLFQQGYTNLFAVMTPAGNYTQSALRALADRGARTVVIAHADALFPASVAEGAKRWAEVYGMEVLAVRTYPRGVADVIDIVTEFRSLTPDVFVGGGYFDDALLFARAARRLDFAPGAMVLTVGPTNPDFMTEVGAGADYLIGPTQWEASMSYRGDYFGSAADYAERFEAKWGRPPTYQAASATAAALALHLAIEAAGSLDRDAVRAALRDMDVETFYGRIGFDSTGKNPDRPMGAVQIRVGQARVVAPPDAAVADLVYPAPGWKER